MDRRYSFMCILIKAAQAFGFNKAIMTSPPRVSIDLPLFTQSTQHQRDLEAVRSFYFHSHVVYALTVSFPSTLIYACQRSVTYSISTAIFGLHAIMKRFGGWVSGKAGVSTSKSMTALEEPAACSLSYCCRLCCRGLTTSSTRGYGCCSSYYERW